jgi:SagB-type dehydrogenase family enzyme
MNNQIVTVLNYHNRTKHRLERYAKGPESIDWEDQPDQFRHFSGCEIVTLPKPGRDLEVLFSALDSPETLAAQPLTVANIGLLMELAFGLSAWKQFGPSRWALRCNPSSGNLHPTEAYLISAGHETLKAGVYHYVSHDHTLEQRCRFSDNVPETSLLIGLSSVHWREAWKYGERAFRYCQHDLGHAIGALRYAAATLGWSIELLAETSDDDIAQVLGLNRLADFKALEAESPDLLCRIKVGLDHKAFDVDELITATQTGVWSGKADSLRAYHLYKWPVIDEVAIAASKPSTKEPAWQALQSSPLASAATQTATSIIRQRRSAQQFDGKMAPMSQADFYRILSAVLPTSPAFQVWRWSAKIHLFIFVHRVEGVTSGVYALPRHYDALEKLKAGSLETFKWERIAKELPLYHLYSGDCRQFAKALSCHQPIASDSAFSLGMVAEFSETINDAAWLYRRLFWETGLIGQVLYLEAEVAGYRGTGIGCFFDDSVHELFGFKDTQFQSLYHFTIGKPLEDKRIETLPAYEHLEKS